MLSFVVMIAVSGYTTLNAQQAKTLSADAVQLTPDMDQSELDQFNAEIRVITEGIKDNNSYTDAQRDSRMYFYKKVYEHVNNGIPLEISMRGALNATRLFIQGLNDPGSVDLRLIQQEAESNLL